MPRTQKLEPMAEWQDIFVTEADWAKLGRDEAVKMHNHLHLVRAFEEMVLEMDGQGLIHGPAHSSIGQEGGAIGSIAPLKPGDQVTGSHRGHHQFIAKALTYLDHSHADPLTTQLSGDILTLLQKSLAEIMGLAQGYCKGRGGSMHLRWAEAGALGTNAIVGGGVPFATGAAWSKKRSGTDEAVFSYFGEGAAHIGSVPEAMNLAALWDLPVCFFIENNGFAVSTSVEEETRETRVSSRGLAFGIPSFRVDGMDPVAVRATTERALEIMRSGKGPAVIEAVLYRFFHHGGGMSASAFGYRNKEDEIKWRERDPLIVMLDGLKQQGWLDDDGDAALAARARVAMQQAASALTIDDGNKRTIIDSHWPDPAQRDAGLRGQLSELNGKRFEEQETFSGAQTEMRYVEAAAEVMNRRMADDARIFCMGEDIHRLKGGTNGVTKGLAEKYPDRIIPTPIAEAGFSGLAGGVAMSGTYRPVVELMYPDFSLVAADQLFNQIGKARLMFGGDAAMPLVFRTKIAIGAGYGSQHSMDPAGLFAQWPGWRIVAPSTAFDYVGLMNAALTCEDPVLVIEHVDLYTRKMQGPETDYDYFIPLGKAKVVKEGIALTILTYSAMVTQSCQAAASLGLDAEIIDLRSLDRAGLDWETIGDSIKKTNNVVVVEQGPLTVSYGAMLTDEIQRRYFDYLDQPVQRVHGGESSPSVSKVLERAAFAMAPEIEAQLRQMMIDTGRGDLIVM
ncbi:thiamine pyrophosphate-dependent enzyme [Ruegeria sp. 2012CJ41-6]|uniref:2-oxoglutarate dehydrogenase E1 component n=1 Tax=Ruegeria spongiae TaxID=2942209 RepID=A0ABT0Q3J2_9RHOB|nr:alpha-ketoacid dehydrogenase subunit alpha/beta [Ruegeria spongiae]MCL6284172.1 thiamine pyrophosphate-dependent enzyme [Ruegeria spongiae]